ncbi:MAG: divergent PAP2 family protein [Gammaproteobacteria bacterium]|nr:divergent PAP2 family protein [Gammaproteobacteria bacterium]
MLPIYILTPIVAWFVAGVMKFVIHSIQLRKSAFHLIGYGGLPSTHTAIVSSMTTLIALKEGIAQPCFGIALTMTMIVIIDANGLRQYIGNHAKVINKLSGKKKLREKIGHSLLEIGAGIAVGGLVGFGMNWMGAA